MAILLIIKQNIKIIWNRIILNTFEHVKLQIYTNATLEFNQFLQHVKTNYMLPKYVNKQLNSTIKINSYNIA